METTETTTYLNFKVIEESKKTSEDDSGRPYYDSELFFYLDGFRVDDLPAEEFKNYILTKLTEQL